VAAEERCESWPPTRKSNPVRPRRPRRMKETLSILTMVGTHYAMKEKKRGPGLMGIRNKMKRTGSRATMKFTAGKS